MEHIYNSCLISNILLFSNSISVIVWSVFIDFPPYPRLWVISSCFLCLVIFNHMSDILWFLVFRFFWYSYKFSWTLFWVVVKLLGMSLDLLLGFVEWVQSSLYFMISPLLTRESSEDSPWFLYACEVFTPLAGGTTNFPASVSFRQYFPSLVVFFTSPIPFYPRHVQTNIKPKILGDPLKRSLECSRCWDSSSLFCFAKSSAWSIFWHQRILWSSVDISWCLTL